MDSPIELLREKAKKDLKKIVLSESEDARIVEAAAKIIKDKIANVVFLGDADDVRRKLQKFGGYNENIVEIIDPKTSELFDVLADRFYEKRKDKNPNKMFFRKLLASNYVFFGAMMVDAKLADGFVAGASHKTSDVAKAAIYCIGVDEAIEVASGAYIMYIKDSQYGDNGLFLFADCGLVPDPNPRQLAGIAISSARLYKKLFNNQPYVAMLSYSTKSSAGGPFVDKVRKGLEEVKKLDANLFVDGELQVDSALDPSIARKKANITSSAVMGRANVLIFPNLDSGNIGYKLVQRLSKARAVGPLIQGLKKPCSDLSRGCSIEDIVDAVAVTAVRAQG
jgi:phosphate acetyltransferase